MPHLLLLIRVDLVVHDLRVASSTVLVGLAGFNIMAIALLADLVVRRTNPG